MTAPPVSGRSTNPKGDAMSDESVASISAAGSRSGAVIDLFAGPGGWDVAARSLGLDPIGLELDGAACATRRAVGLRTMQCDVGAVDLDAPVVGWPGTRVWGLIASPPCQAYSVAGKGGGARDVEHVVACALELAAGNDTRAEHAERCEDPRSILVVEPLRWAHALKPRWIACEQVPPVLELWTLFAQILGSLGYSTWAGVLEAERYGVPQTRERAVLMASLDVAVQPPRATHQRYEYGIPARHDLTFDGEVLPFVTMADALGWRDTWVQRERSGDRAQEGFDPHAMPCQTLTSKSRSWTLHRPATTIAGDSRVFQPGGHHTPGAQPENAIRVTPAEASVLQSFPPDYPWQGSRTAQFQQIGNAVPPDLAGPILASVTGRPWTCGQHLDSQAVAA